MDQQLRRTDNRVPRARKLRRDMTFAERKLWWCLRRIPMPRSHFRWQATIGPFFVDFGCHALKLVIEIDGGQHNNDDRRVADLQRTRFLESEGYQVLRFWNNEVLGNIEGVIESIAAAVRASQGAPTPDPSPPLAREQNRRHCAQFTARSWGEGNPSAVRQMRLPCAYGGGLAWGHRLVGLTPLIVALLVLASVAQAQTPAEFYKGRSVDVYIGTSVGGGYDAYARMLSRHMGRHLPGNPILVPKTMEGGGGMRLANFLYNAAPKDGSAFATFNRGIGFDPLLGNRGAQFDATKFNWIGSANDEVSVCVAWHTSGVARYQDLFTRELVVGASGPAADTYQFPKIANSVLHTRFRIITGYPGGNDIDLAMERGEVQGRCGWSWTSVKATHQPWLDQNKIHLLFQIGLAKHPDLPNVPLIMDLAKSGEERAIFKVVFGRQVMAWPFAAAPGVPQERVEALRKAFMDTMADKEFLAEAEKAGLEVRAVSGANVQKLVADIYATPSAIVQRTIQLLQ